MNKQVSDIQQVVLLPNSIVEQLQLTQQKILEKLESIQTKKSDDEYLTAQEFMDKVKICRASFDLLRSENKIEVFKKGRKLYLKASAVKKYFES